MELPYSNLKVTHWNPGASLPLIIPIHVVCNVDDDIIYENVRVNSQREQYWFAARPEHSRVAVICGSGPSLADNLFDVREWRDMKADIFALNGAATYLDRHGICPDYQVLIDARLQTADLVGPAEEHLIASQCDPECFKRAPAPTLWHLQLENLDDLLPDYPHPYTEIGGAASVGNTALCLVYAMGYRTMHLYGYDSSNRETMTHAFHQPMNAGDPMAMVKFNGKDYTCSLTMKLQAERFIGNTRPALLKLGCNIEVHGTGLLPDMARASSEVLAQYEQHARDMTGD